MAAATMYVTPAGAGTKAGNDWANAMGLAEFETDVEGAAEAGDIYYVAGGTYTLTQVIDTACDGSYSTPIQVIGVAAGTSNEPPVFSDWANGDDRPLFACGTYYVAFDDYWRLMNLRGTGSHASQVFRTDLGSVVVNVKCANSGSGAGLLFGSSSCKAIRVEASSASGTAINGNQNDMFFLGCYAHDSTTGITFSSYGKVAFCIAEACGTGISTASNYGVIFGNTIQGNTTGISGAYATTIAAMNNIIAGNTTGASWSSSYVSNYFDYNDWYGNTSDVSNVTKGPNALAVDPQFTNAAGGDFSIGTNLKAAGFPGAFPGGLSTGYLDIGAVQRQEAGGAAGGLLVHPGMAGGMRG